MEQEYAHDATVGLKSESGHFFDLKARAPEVDGPRQYSMVTRIYPGAVRY